MTCVPGVIRYKGAKIQVCFHPRNFLEQSLLMNFQLLDLPGIIEGARLGKGRGRQVIAVARTCSLILIVLDALQPLTHKRILEVCNIFCYLHFMFV